MHSMKRSSALSYLSQTQVTFGARRNALRRFMLAPALALVSLKCSVTHHSPSLCKCHPHKSIRLKDPLVSSLGLDRRQCARSPQVSAVKSKPFILSGLPSRHIRAMILIVMRRKGLLSVVCSHMNRISPVGKIQCSTIRSRRRLMQLLAKRGISRRSAKSQRSIIGKEFGLMSGPEFG